jgi:hypothetical protein
MMNYRKEASEQVSDANILEVGKYLFSKSQHVKTIGIACITLMLICQKASITLMLICQKGVLILP